MGDSSTLAQSTSSTNRLAGTAYAGGQNTQYLFDLETELSNCVKFVQCMRKTLAMFNIENKFISKVFDDNSSNSNDRVTACRILNRIFDPVLKLLTNDANVMQFLIEFIIFVYPGLCICLIFKILRE